MEKRRLTSNAEVLADCQRTLKAERRSIDPAARTERGCPQPQKGSMVCGFETITAPPGRNRLLRLRKAALRTLAIAALGLFSALFLARPTFAQTNALDALVTGQNKFALDLYANLKSREGNLFFSPYSISTCLAMAYSGARGNTAKQMANTLHFDFAPTQTAGPMGELEKQLNAPQSQTWHDWVELHTANGLWAQQGHPFLPAFITAAQQDFDASVQQVDFQTQSEPVRNDINTWVSEKTKGKITDLFPKGSLNPDSRLVLVNAIYFKRKWRTVFETNDTTDAQFYTRATIPVQVRMMSMTEDFRYADTNGLQLLEIPYFNGGYGGELSMIILLPEKIDGISKLEKILNTLSLKSWMSLLDEKRVRVFIPKFKTTQEFSLGNNLQTMGMRDAFSDDADFSGIDGMRDLYISAVVHKAFIDVNEQGTEATAATGSMLDTAGIPRSNPPPVFRADHPFIFFIWDTQAGSILFLGRVNDPTK